MTEKADNTPDKKADSLKLGAQPVGQPASDTQPEDNQFQARSTPMPSATEPTFTVGNKNKKRSSSSGAAPAYGVLAVVVVLAGAALWYQHQSISTLKSELQAQLATTASGSDRALQLAQQALSQLQRQTASLSTLESANQRSQEQFQDLSLAFQALTDKGSDLILLNDIDHLVTIAQQQLMLGGNVANAIIALESAQAQLARANRVRLAPLQQTINGDLDRLRAAATVDVSALSRQLETLGSLLSQAPLLVPDEVAAGAQGDAITAGSTMAIPEQSDPQAVWWQKALNTLERWGIQTWRSVSHDLGQFVSIRRVDDAAALMMSPDQAARFRESLSLRVMTAQMAMMMNQSELWQKELAAIGERLERRFDKQSPKVQQAMRLVRQLQETQIGASLPTVNNTLAAIESLRSEQDDSQPPGENPTTQEPQAQAHDDDVPDSQHEATIGDLAPERG